MCVALECHACGVVACFSNILYAGAQQHAGACRSALSSFQERDSIPAFRSSTFSYSIVITMPFYSTVFQPASSMVGCFILFPASVISTVTFIEPSHVGLRTAVLVFGISQALQFRGLPHMITRSRAVNGILAQFLWVYVMRSFDLLLLRRAYFPAKESEVKVSSTLPKEQDAVGRANEKAKQTSRTSGTTRFLQSFYLFFTLRDIGTPHTIKNIPLFSASDPTWVPSRTAFLIRHTIIAVVGYLVADIPSIMPPIDPKVAAQMNLPVFSRLFDIGIEEAITRFILTTSSWIFGLATLSSFHSSLAVLFVGLGLSEPRFWPPQFGSLKDSTSLRGWWG
jgi:hypothetical protein